MPGEFEGKKVVVAGVVGVGRGCVEWFAREGATVGVLDPRASELCAQLDADGARLVPKDVELNDWAAISECARWWLDEYHGLDVLVNAHTATDYTGVEDAVIESVENVVSVNLVGPLVCSQAFLPGLKVSGAGAIVNASSIHGFFGFPKMAAYSISKGGLITLTHVMAGEFAPYGIRVNCIARAGLMEAGGPGENAGVVDATKLFADTPLGRPATYDEFGSVAGFLASPRASYVTGATVAVDGGRTAVTRGTS